MEYRTIGIRYGKTINMHTFTHLKNREVLTKMPSIKNIGYVFYYIFKIVPRAIIMRLKGEDKLDLDWQDKKDSYWEG